MSGATEGAPDDAPRETAAAPPGPAAARDVDADPEADADARARRVRAPRLAGLALVAGGAAVGAWLGWRSSVGQRVVDAVFEERSFERIEAYAPLLRATAAEFDLEPELLAGIMYAESRGRNGQVSSKGALGLMQLSPAAAADAARRLGLEPPAREAVLEDAELNVRLAGSHLRWLFTHEERAGEAGLVAVLVAYNAGRTKLLRWIREAGDFRRWRAEREAAGDSQVLAYARAVIGARDRFRDRGVLSPP